MARPREGTAWFADGSWFVQITLNGGERSKPRRLGPEITSKPRAKEAAKAWSQREQAKGTVRAVVLADGTSKPAKQTIVALAVEWLKLIDGGELAPSTRAGHHTASKKWIEAFGTITPMDCRPVLSALGCVSSRRRWRRRRSTTRSTACPRWSTMPSPRTG